MPECDAATPAVKTASQRRRSAWQLALLGLFAADVAVAARGHSFLALLGRILGATLVGLVIVARFFRRIGRGILRDGEFEVFERFKELSQGKTAVLISHRFSSVRMADRILVLADGKVEASGTHDELMAQGGRYAELFELQAAGYR